MKIKTFIARITKTEEEEKEEESSEVPQESLLGKLKQKRIEKKKALEEKLKSLEKVEQTSKGEKVEAKEEGDKKEESSEVKVETKQEEEIQGSELAYLKNENVTEDSDKELSEQVSTVESELT